MKYRQMKLDDYDELIKFWKKNYFVNELDTKEQFKVFFRKNPGLSILVEEDGRIIATALGSYDGRRGYVQKLVVDKDFRRKSIGKKLLEKMVDKLHKAGAKYIPISCEVEMRSFYESAGFNKTSQITVSRK